jgi:hypothetical protein
VNDELRTEKARAIAAVLGYPLADCTLVASSQRRTALGRTAGGIDLVVKWGLSDDWPGTVERAVDIAGALRDRGYPAPATLAHGPARSLGYGWLQRALPGEPSGLPDDALLTEILSAVELQADPAPRHMERWGGWSWTAAAVYQDEGGWWAAAERAGGDVARAARRLGAWLAEVPRVGQTDDYVHLDLNFSNVLEVDGRLSGIIDLDTVGLGHRGVDLAYLALQYAGAAYEQGRQELPDAYYRLREETLRLSGEPTWRHGMAYSCIAWLGWSNPEGFSVGERKAASTVSAVLTAERQWEPRRPGPAPTSVAR